jgi:hypothetical protein
MKTDQEAIDQLSAALARMYAMWEMMMAKVNHGKSFYDADTLREMNEAPIQAYKALALVGKSPPRKP